MQIYTWQMDPNQLSIDHCNTTTLNHVLRNMEIALYRPSAISPFSPFHITYAHRPSLSHATDCLHAVEIWNLVSRNMEIALIQFHHFQDLTYGHSPPSLSPSLSLSLMQWTVFMQLKYGISYQEIWR